MILLVLIEKDVVTSQIIGVLQIAGAGKVSLCCIILLLD